jgi:hypothetical protein
LPLPDRASALAHVDLTLLILRSKPGQVRDAHRERVHIVIQEPGVHHKVAETMNHCKPRTDIMRVLNGAPAMPDLFATGL